MRQGYGMSFTAHEHRNSKNEMRNNNTACDELRKSPQYISHATSCCAAELHFTSPTQRQQQTQRKSYAYTLDKCI